MAKNQSITQFRDHLSSITVAMVVCNVAWMDTRNAATMAAHIKMVAMAVCNVAAMAACIKTATTAIQNATATATMSRSHQDSRDGRLQCHLDGRLHKDGYDCHQ